MLSHKSFLILFVLILASHSQVLKPISYCMGKCQNCQSFQLTRCTPAPNKSACEAGYELSQNTTCELVHSMDSPFVYTDFNAESDLPLKIETVTDWNQGKVAKCSYINDNGKQRHFNSIGLFREIHSISKEFQVSENFEVYFISFNLIRNSWMPYNDFLIVDIEAGLELVQSSEISYDSRTSFNTSNLIVCNGQAVVSQKFKLKALKKSFNSSKLKVTVTGFLFTAAWGLSNFRLIPGCQHFTVYNKLTEKCDFCDIGFYPIYQPGTEAIPNNYFKSNSNNTSNSSTYRQLIACQICSQQCATCITKTNCTSCVNGYKLDKNSQKCVLKTQNDTRSIIINEFLQYQTKYCSAMGFSFIKNTNTTSPIQRLISQNYSNPKATAIGNSTLVFSLVYNSKFKADVNASITVLANSKSVYKIIPTMLVNKGFESCSVDPISRERYSVFLFEIPLTDLPESVSITLISNQLKKGSMFGVKAMELTYVLNRTLTQNAIEGIQIFDSLEEAKKSLSSQKNSASGNSKGSSINGSQKNIVPEKMVDENVPFITSPGNSNIFGNSPSLSPSPAITSPTQPIPSSANSEPQIKSSASSTDIVNNDSAFVFQKNPQNFNLNPAQNTTSNPAKNLTAPVLKNILPISPNQIDHIQWASNGNSGIWIQLPYQPQFKDQQFILTIRDSPNSPNFLYTTVAQPVTSYEQPNTKQRVMFIINRNYHNVYIQITSTNDPFETVVGFEVDRIDHISPQQQQAINGLEGMFIFFCWLALVVFLLSALVGKIALAAQLVLSMQMALLLSVYVFATYAPSSILNTVSGLQRIRNFNIFVSQHLESLEKLFLGDMVQSSPLRFTQLNQDVNFTRNIIPLVFILILLAVWAGLILLLKKIFLSNISSSQAKAGILAYPSPGSAQQNPNSEQDDLNHQQLSQLPILHRQIGKIYINIISRPGNYFSQLLLVCFIPITQMSLAQFHNFTYPSAHPSGEVFNMLLCLIVFILTLVAVFAVVLFIEQQYYKLEYELFLNQYPDMYYKRIPRDFLPTQHHLLGHPLIRYFKMFGLVGLITIFGDYPIPMAISLIVLKAAETIYNWQFEIFQPDSIYFKFHLAENVLFTLMLVLIIIARAVSSFAQVEGFLALGYVYMSIVVVLVLLAFGRAIYLIVDHVKGGKGMQKWKQYVAEQGAVNNAPMKSERLV